MKVLRTLAGGLLLLATPLVGAVDYTSLPALERSNLQESQLNDIALCGERLIAVGDRGAAIYSDDGGEQWTQGAVPVSQLLTAVYCLEDGHAWAVGHGGVIIASDDGGENWRLQFDGNEANQQWLEYVKQHELELSVQIENLGDAVDEDLEFALEDASFAIEDAAEAIETGPADPLLGIWFRDAKYGIAVGAYGMIYRTTDGGESWQILAAGIENSERYHYYSVAAAQDGTLYLSGEAGLMYRSDNEGKTWERLDIGYDGSLFGTVTTPDGAVLAFGLRGNILRSEDRGATWQTIQPQGGGGLSLYGGKRLGNGDIVLVGGAAVVLSSTDGGLSFTGQQLPSRSSLSAVVKNTNNRLLVVGMDGLEAVTEGAQ